jgi:hypothetical protein
VKLALAFLAGFLLRSLWQRAEERWDRGMQASSTLEEPVGYFIGSSGVGSGGNVAEAWRQAQARQSRTNVADYATRRMAYERETGFGLDE